jgi:hypothetical protein
MLHLPKESGKRYDQDDSAAASEEWSDVDAEAAEELELGLDVLEKE